MAGLGSLPSSHVSESCQCYCDRMLAKKRMLLLRDLILGSSHSKCVIIIYAYERLLPEPFSSYEAFVRQDF